MVLKSSKVCLNDQLPFSTPLAHHSTTSSIVPPEEQLVQSLFEWQRLGYTTAQQLVKLQEEYNYSIS
jgi:hypothetical protein